MKMKKPKRPRDLGNDIVDAVESVTEDVDAGEEVRRAPSRLDQVSVGADDQRTEDIAEEAAWKVMEEAYMAASSGGTLPTTARQVFYKARPKIMKMTDNRPLMSQYFTQTLLPDYMETHGLDWDVVFDARGHIEEPHTNMQIGLGTLEVRNYLGAMRMPNSSSRRCTARRRHRRPGGSVQRSAIHRERGLHASF